MSVSFDCAIPKVPTDAYVILGQAHFVETVEDLFEGAGARAPTCGSAGPAAIGDQSDAAQRHEPLPELGYQL